MYQHRHLLCWLKPPVMFLMNNRSRSTLMPNHHMVHRKFCLLIPRRTPSQWRRIVAIPDVTITLLTGIVFLNRAVGLCSCVLYLALSSVRGKECSVCYWFLWLIIIVFACRVLPSQYVYSLTATCISCRAYSTHAQCRSRIHAYCSSNVRCAIVIWVIVTVTSCRLQHLRACWGTHDATENTCISLHHSLCTYEYAAENFIHFWTFLWGIWPIHVAKMRLIVGHFDHEGLQSWRNCRSDWT